MLLKPFEEEVAEVVVLRRAEHTDAIQEALREGGLNETSVEHKDKKAAKVERIREIFDKHGASLENSAKSLARLNFSDNDAVRFNAAKTIAAIHGAMRELDESTAPVIHLTIQASGEKNIFNLVVPRG